MTTKKKRIAKIMDSLIIATMCILLLPLSRCNDKAKSPANAPMFTSVSENRATKTTKPILQTVNPASTK